MIYGEISKVLQYCIDLEYKDFNRVKHVSLLFATW